MLQQTQAARVVPAYRAFLRAFPSVAALARAPRSSVVSAWSGLGYNRRAVALADAARAIVAEHRGHVPRDVEALRALPGVGPYTAAAIASIAFGEPLAALDVNVRRVVARARLGAEPHRLGAAAIDAAATRWLDRHDPGAWNQALMDLGREHCRSVPRCEGCPLRRGCRFVRGAVVRALRGGPVTVAAIARATGFPGERVGEALAGLARDGLVVAGPAAVCGAPGGRARLCD